MLSAEESAHVSRSKDRCQKTGQGHVREQELVRVEGVKTQETLAHVDETLGDPHQEQLVLGRLTLVVAAKVSEVTSQLRVVSTGATKTQSKDSAHRDISI